MRIGSLILGLIAIVAGGVWILQGSGVLPGSFMTGQRMWLIMGVIVAIVVLALAYNGIRRLARPLLLVGATLVIIAVYGVASMLSARVFPRRYLLVLTAATALVSAIIAIVAFSPSDSALGAVAEVVLLAGMV